MNVWASIVVLVLQLTAEAACEEDKPCCMPDQWHGEYLQNILEIGQGAAKTSNNLMDMTYDAPKQRVAVKTSNTDSNGNAQQFLHLSFYEDKVEYQFNLGDQSCVKKALETPFSLLCLPPMAKVTDPSVVLGSGKNAVTGKLWSFVISTPDITIDAKTVVTDDANCVPVYGYELQTFPSAPDAYKVVVSDYQDVTKGIDENVFAIPDACQQ
ncbi:hypothetical protein ACOMHN_007772 [Nucella lapillus]